MASAAQMPIGLVVGNAIHPDDVKVDANGLLCPVFHDEAMATIVSEDYDRARAYIENNTWLNEWQHNDILYQSPTLDRGHHMHNGRPARVSRFDVATNTKTMATQVKRAVFGEQVPFTLRPIGKTTEWDVDAWTALLSELLKRMKLQYFSGLQIDTQVLQGTGLGKYGWDTKTRVVKTRKRKKPPAKASLPVGGDVTVPTVDSDAFTLETTVVTESWPFYEYRRLGTTLFDPKTSTPNRPDLSAGYVIDIDYVTFEDLEDMRKLDCYKNIPSAEVLKAWFVMYGLGSAAPASTLADQFTAQGSNLAHAEGENRQTSANPLLKPVMLIERWTQETVATILRYEGRKLLIRSEEHGMDSDCHTAVNWYNVDNALYGMGTGRMVGPDQRINAGVLNACLAMLAYPMNAPLLIAAGQNAPTQNVLARLGGFMQVQVPPGGDVRKATGFMEMPQIPPEAFHMIEMAQQSGQQVSGANAPFMQGAMQSAGSTAARTAAGANRIASKADDSIADPVENVAEGIVVRVVVWLMKMVKEKMPLSEIRAILKANKAKIILRAIDEDRFLNAEMEVTVLAGQRLMAKAGIQQMLPFLLQLVQQPQILEYYHQIGKTIDFAVIEDLFMQLSELGQQDDIVRDMTEQEKAAMRQNNPTAAKVQGAAALEDAKTKGKIAVVQTQGQVDLANKAAEVAMEHTAEGIPLAHAQGLLERKEDEAELQGGWGA